MQEGCYHFALWRGIRRFKDSNRGTEFRFSKVIRVVAPRAGLAPELRDGPEYGEHPGYTTSNAPH